jgi:NADPH:quinone reductase-like Zn-dependent oxidoreductase
MPKVVRFYEIGGPEKLKLQDEPSRQPGEGEVRLRVQATGLNRAEAMYMRGHYFEQPTLPSRIGYEAAGVVEAVGPGVDKSWLGGQAATFPGYSMNQYGILGEEAIVPATALAEYPKTLSPAEGAALWMKYGTAWGALVHFGRLAAGDFVVISAASSSVGLAAIQMVKDAGAVSIATTRTGTKKKELIELGADHVIASEEEDLPARVKEITGGKGARLIFDPIGGPFVEKLAEAAAPQGIIFEYGVLSMQPTTFPTRAAMQKGLSLRGYTLMEFRNNPAVLDTAKKYIYDRLADGRFVPKIAKTFPLAQAREAYEYLESNAQVGKVVITVP